ncbi:hypothetical protein AMAG_17475 [Allomyces macrogynus ATCC 38327]|uniref:Uncharacterized protein n=1 Tax=Allomyces macrogynus (strain ATCC 38327) TaxID=578462 RepID=A0A0L0TEY7_ALLM3|nr:hypothetical protein AMAG_17475 [Allomyces macrogynus ATCC 38327]|eukprot:KNE73307.1 hypothetical protein AMAG_17475 [Allomyces macrogynus ATCC 38327]
MSSSNSDPPPAMSQQRQLATTAASNTYTDVVKNSARTGLVGAVVGAAVGSARRLPVAPTAANMCFMWGAVSFAFFAARKEIAAHFATLDANQPRKPVVLNRHHLLASTAAGLATGAVTTALVHGPRTAIPASLIAGLLAGTGQLVVTWGRHARQDALLWRAKQQGLVVTDEGVRAPDVPEPRAPGLWESVSAQVHDVLVHTTWLPVRALSDEAYLESLRDQLAAQDESIAKYDRVLKRLQARMQELHANGEADESSVPADQ